ncbi:hypothetical protein HWV62_7471 [Athelia sp. TMB]|nr:hypothetical protein HWV62_7471 [Athelia sp. TMB]
MTFATLRALHALIGDAIDDIERVFAENSPALAFPSLEEPVYHPRRSDDLGEATNRAQAGAQAGGVDRAPKAEHGGQETSQIHSGKEPEAKASDVVKEQERKKAAEILLATHPDVLAATNRIVAATGHLAACVRDPFLSLCDASMGYHLPACMRFLEATHIVEVLRDAEESGEDQGGMHVSKLAARIGVSEGRVAHILRLLATHHILTELAPDVFANNRLSSRLDSGKRSVDLLGSCSSDSFNCDPCTIPEVKLSATAQYSPGAKQPDPSPNSPQQDWHHNISPLERAPKSDVENSVRKTIDEQPNTQKRPSLASKYEGSNGVAAFVGLCTDEIFKAAAYMSEAYVPTLSPTSINSLNEGKHGDKEGNGTGEIAPFSHAFGTRAGYFSWLEEGGMDPRFSPIHPSPFSASFSLAPSTDSGLGWGSEERGSAQERRKGSTGSILARGPDSEEGLWLKGKAKNALAQPSSPPGGSKSRFRLERFGKAMTGTSAWEQPAGLLNSAFDWASLAPGSTLVDVGGGVGSVSLSLATHLGTRVRFVVQDRERVCAMGRAACDPTLLENGVMRFDAHDFFTRQPITDPAVFLLRAILHDWPDAEAARILCRLRDAAGPQTKLIIADHVLPLACADDFGGANGTEGEGVEVEGVERMLAPPPLLANLGKASANAYWMDMTMHAMFNAKERTLRELVALARSTGWKVVRVARAQGSLFAHVVAIPCEPPAPVPAPWACEFSEVAGVAGGLGLGLGSPFSPSIGRVVEEDERDEFGSRSGSAGGSSGPVSPSAISPNGGPGLRRVVRKKSSLGTFSIHRANFLWI